MPKKAALLSAGKIALGVQIKHLELIVEYRNIVFKYVLCLADVYSDYFG